MNKNTKVVLALVFGLGIIFGGFVLPHPTETKYEVIHHTDTKTRTVTETKTEYVVPDECNQLADLAAKISEASMTIDNSTVELLDIMSATRTAIASKDFRAVNDLETQLRQLKARNVRAVMDLTDYKADLVSLTRECESK